MNKEILFAQKLGEIRELAKEQGNYVTKEQNGADISIGFDEYVEQEGYEEVDTANCKKI